MSRRGALAAGTATARAVVLGLMAAALGGCGQPGATLDAASLGLPTTDATPQATQQVATSPDGGIYRNPDRLDVVYVGPVDGAAVAARLGAPAQEWAELQQYGSMTAIALHLHNDGKGGSEPELDDLQVASDLAPAGADSGTLRHYFHPAFPMAALSDLPLSGNCTVHLDPGQSATVVLVYPPLRDTPVVWGRYKDFALTLRRGGGVGRLGDRMSVAPCQPPSRAPA